jgi:hypothetical protein
MTIALLEAAESEVLEILELCFPDSVKGLELVMELMARVRWPVFLAASLKELPQVKQAQQQQSVRPKLVLNQGGQRNNRRSRITARDVLLKT